MLTGLKTGFPPGPLNLLGLNVFCTCFQVKVILGEDREATGILLSIDGDDGIVRMELDDQLKILNLRFLGRLEH
ncbi:Transcription elongation factor SPT5 [Goodea atripinnis]|uniref:Transcription elongation factor SPT5 n=1 Tax=Goodea atripinnis TaxID=208336 RepID=A0ABV0MX79_9TELE